LSYLVHVSLVPVLNVVGDQVTFWTNCNTSEDIIPVRGILTLSYLVHVSLVPVLNVVGDQVTFWTNCNTSEDIIPVRCILTLFYLVPIKQSLLTIVSVD
jgi:hypothetical protein